MRGSFEEKLREGQEGEREVGNFLIGRGMHLVPLYQYINNNAAPLLFSKARRLILPDLDVYADGRSFFVEVKRKNQWVRFNGSCETGLDDRHARQYRDVAVLTRKPVHLVFLHKAQAPTGLFRIPLDLFIEKARLWDGLRASDGKRISPPMRLCAREHLTAVPDFVDEAA